MTISNVISEIDVLVVSDPQFSLYLLQFGSKPLNFDFGSENIDTAKISRKKDQGEAFSKNAMAKDLSHTSKYLEKKVFTTHSASSVNGNEEFIGVFKLGVLYLLPISHILELKPTLNYLDKSSSFTVSKNKDGDIFDGNPDEEMDPNPDSEYNETTKTEVINVKFATQNIKTWELSQQKQNSATDSKSSGENVQTNDLGQHNYLSDTNLIPLDKMHFKSLDMIEAGNSNNNHNANDKHTWIDLTYLGRDNRYIENLVTTSYSQSILPCQYQTLPHECNDKFSNHSSNSKSESTMLNNGSEIKSKPILYMNTLLKPLMVTVPFPEKVDSSLEKNKNTNNPNNSEMRQLLSRLLNKSTSLTSCLKPKQHNYNNNAHQILARSQKSVVDQSFCFTMIFELLQRAQILPFSIIWDHFLSRYLHADTNKTNNEKNETVNSNNINLSIREKLKLKRAIIEYLDTIATVCAGNWVIKSQYLYNSPVANNKDVIKPDSGVKDATQSNIITTNNKIDGNLANINTSALPKLCNLRNRNNLNSNHNNNTNSNNNRISRLETQKMVIENLCLQARDFILYCFDVGETYHNMHFDNTSIDGTTKSLNSKSLPFYLTRMDVKQYFPELPTTDLTKIFEGIAKLKKLTPTIQGWCLKYGLDNLTTTNLSHSNNNNNNNTFDCESNEIIDKNNQSFRMVTLKHLLDVVKNHKNFKKFDITINNYYGNDNKNIDDKINKQTWVKGVQKFLASANNPATNNNISHKYSLEKQIEEYNVLMQFIISTRTKKDYTSDTSNLNHNTNPKIKSPHTLSPTSPRRKRLKSITANINNGSSLNVIPSVPVVKTEFDIDDHVVGTVDINKGTDNLPTSNLSNLNTSDNDTTNNQGLSVVFSNDQKPDLTLLNKLLHSNVDTTSINGANYSDYIIQSNTNMTTNETETCTVSQQTTVNTNDFANTRTVAPTRRSTLKIKANIGKDMTKQRK